MMVSPSSNPLEVQPQDVHGQSLLEAQTIVIPIIQPTVTNMGDQKSWTYRLPSYDRLKM